MQWIEGTKIGAIAHRAAADLDLHMQIVYCPEKLVRDWELSPEEAHVLRTADLSKVRLDDETLELARAMFETPKAGLADVRSSYRIWGKWSDIRSSQLCS